VVVTAVVGQAAVTWRAAVTLLPLRVMGWALEVATPVGWPAQPPIHSRCHGRISSALRRASPGCWAIRFAFLPSTRGALAATTSCRAGVSVGGRCWRQGCWSHLIGRRDAGGLLRLLPGSGGHRTRTRARPVPWSARWGWARCGCRGLARCWGRAGSRRVAVPEPGQGPGIQRRSSTRQPRPDV